ncbi:hypothetical protein K402DRAFT_331023 [Aulographum hederae CBS 113979]|uniref:Cyclin-like protein n=1 Tax=Aulographum hederae CBS 113979 TaxID=1176131 RepID=A0A6G1H2G2_9PEZI|nr:hypothetical protein K402DRAFT_331023 [Aulographum hederae CBS 113979]
MPSFYPRPMPRHHLPPTPPDNYSQGFNTGHGGGNSCASMQYSANLYANQPAFGYQDDATNDFTDPYGSRSASTQVPATTAYQQSQPPAYVGSAVSIPPVHQFYEPSRAPLLPPMRTYDPSVYANELQQRRNEATLKQQQAPKEEKPVGGVSAKLDYDMDVMTDFVSEKAQGIIHQTQMVPASDVRKWVHSVLCATRLPSATILLSLHYLSTRVTELSKEGRHISQEHPLHYLLTTALILGSKFLDDNTFINRSWSEVSSIDVATLNKLEMDWLIGINFTLHRDLSGPHGFDSWYAHWKQYEADAMSRSVKSLKLSPLDTSVQRQQSVHRTFTPSVPQSGHGRFSAQDYHSLSAQSSQYTPSGYGQFDPWLMRSATESSPASAPHTGPTTPEYYAGAGTWAPPDGHPRRTMFGFSQLSSNAPQPSAQPQSATYVHTPYTPQYNYHGWNGHAAGCVCAYCARNQAPYYMPQSFGPLTVAG